MCHNPFTIYVIMNEDNERVFLHTFVTDESVVQENSSNVI